MPELDLSDSSGAPVLDTLVEMTAMSLANCGLTPRDLMLSRLAALAAVGAPPASYLLNAGAAAEVGVTLADVQGVLVAVAPVIGTPRTLLAATNVTEALGFAVAVAEAALATDG